MKVILLKDIPKLGKKFEVKEVAEGHALNMLIPNGSVKQATPKALKEIEALKIELAAELKIQEDLLAKNLHEIEGKVVEIKVQANKQGHLFAGIHAQEIADFIKKSTHAEILPEFITLEKPIKEIGDHKIEVTASGKKAYVTLSISAK
ncbi:MAG: 50S ribosomal protein L9 [Candidatus Paceibacterota bacterium]